MPWLPHKYTGPIDPSPLTEVVFVLLVVFLFVAIYILCFKK